MTLRECSQSFVDTFVSKHNYYYNAGSEVGVGEFTSLRWNVLHSNYARDYIIEKLNQRITTHTFDFAYNQDNRVFCLDVRKKTPLKVPISTLTLDEEFTWDKVSLC